MCSVPGLPTTGSEVSVFITKVNLYPSCGLVELWVNMDDGRKPAYEQMKKEIQIPKRMFYGLEGNPGDFCLVCISDTWHRARIVSIQIETYNLFLIDQGQPHIATSEALAWANNEGFFLPPEVESCILAHVLSLENNWPEKATKFLKSLPGKKFKGLVQHVLMPERIILLDIPIVSKHMCKFGVAKKIPGGDFKSLVLKFLHLPKASQVTQEQNLNVTSKSEKHGLYFYPELSTDTFVTIDVTEVNDPQNFFCKLQIFSKAVEVLSEEIHQYYEESSDLTEVQPKTCGEPCAARGTNGKWHRSLLKQNIVTDEGAVEVLHVDEGKTELIQVRDIRPLHEKFLKLPVVTYVCSLGGLKGKDTRWTTEQTDYLKSVLLNQTVMARFDHHNIHQNVYDVTLYTANAACINKYFLEKAELFPSSESEQDSNGQSESIPSAFLSSHGGELCVDSKNKVIVNDLQAQTLQSVKNLEVNGRMDGVPTSSTGDIHTTGFSDYPNNKHINSEHGSIMLPSEMDGARDDDDALTVGSTINVKVSCIESLQKFWCQSTENGDHLRLLMEDLQNHCASTNSQPLVESVCVARNPDNNTWYRAKIVTDHNSPVVDVRFIDYGQTRKVPLKDLCPIDPAFLRLKAQAFQCCLFDLRNSTNPTAVSEFEKFVNSSAKSNTRLKCVVKAVTCEEGQLLNMVDIETPSDSVCELLAAQTEVNMHLSHQVPSDAYSYYTHTVEVGGKEKVWITSAENVTHFCCQLERNSHLLEKVNENVEQIISHPQCTDDPPEINSICIARYTDNQWYRGQIVEMSPKFKVHFVDYGDTLAVNKSDIRSFPSESFARSIPVQAVQLGLFDIPEEVPHEVNQWFADHASGRSFTISVVAKDAEGKLMVELFNESLNLNMKVRERISVMMDDDERTTGFIQQANLQLSNSSEQPSVPKENSALEVEHGMTSDNHEETALAKTSIQDGHSDSEKTPLFLTSSPEGNTTNCRYKRPTISQNQTEEVYATCIVGPHYFWCQYSNAEVLNSVSVLAQEAGQAQQDIMFPETLAPGNPCLALFSADNQWYRAQVIQRNGNTLNVLFVDYGNESDIDIKNVRPIPQSLLDEPPQAFLCSLNGFDESSGSWDDKVYDDFYNLMVDKAVTVTVFDMQNHSEIAVPQYAVKVEFDSVVVDSLMQKYWNPYAKTDMDQTETIPQIESNMSQHNVSRGNVKTCVYKNLNLSKNEMVDVYATCIVEPHYFWCQYASPEDLTKLSALVQEAGQVQLDLTVSETFVPGSPCLALFPSDNQWYRAQLIQREGNALRVLFIDYGNESDVDIINVRSVPQTLLDMPPLAFLCSMDGFDEPKSSWDDQVYDYFYNLLVDKPLRVTVFGVEDHSEIAVPQYTVQIQCGNVLVNNALQKHWKPVATEHVMTQSPQTENSLCSGQTKDSAKHLNVSKENACTSTYKKLKMLKNQAECVYASCIVDPHYFWCQYANTEDLNKLSALAQEAGQVPQDMTLSEMLVPGSPCLALFSTDNRWYRAQVIQRNDDMLHVLFIDYGNESDVDISNVRSLPQILLDKAPGAFLCSMNGFDKSKGTWDDQVYDDFYNLLVDKPLRVMISNMEDHSEIAVPQFAVDIECDGVVVNTWLMKYWKELDYSGPE